MIPSNVPDHQIGQRDRLIEYLGRLDTLMHHLKHEADELQSLRSDQRNTSGVPGGVSAYIPGMTVEMDRAGKAICHAHDEVSSCLLVLSGCLANEDGLRGVCVDGTWGGRPMSPFTAKMSAGEAPAPLPVEEAADWVVIYMTTGRVPLYYVNTTNTGDLHWSGNQEQAVRMEKERAGYVLTLAKNRGPRPLGTFELRRLPAPAKSAPPAPAPERRNWMILYRRPGVPTRALIKRSNSGALLWSTNPADGALLTEDEAFTLITQLSKSHPEDVPFTIATSLNTPGLSLVRNIP